MPNDFRVIAARQPPLKDQVDERLAQPMPRAFVGQNKNRTFSCQRTPLMA